MIDFQQTYRSGVMALEGAEQALAAGARLLAAARAMRRAGGARRQRRRCGHPYDIRAQIGAISPEVAPAEGNRWWSSSSRTPSATRSWRRPCAHWGPGASWCWPVS